MTTARQVTTTNSAGAAGGGGRLAVIAGGGQLPLSVAHSAMADGWDVVVFGIREFADPAIETLPHRWFSISEFSKAVRAVRAEGCSDIVMIGSVRRPERWRLGFGLALARTLLANLDLMWSGDSTLLTKIVRIIEREGFTVRGAHEVAPKLLLPAGRHSRVAPNARDERDILLAIRAAHALGALDIGQAAVAARGRILGVEAAEGTDALLERVAGLNRRGKDRCGVLVKWPQPIQDLRIDMPTIGPTTVERAAAAGLAGIAVASGRVLAVEIEALLAAADQHGLFVIGRDDDPAGP